MLVDVARVKSGGQLYIEVVERLLLFFQFLYIGFVLLVLLLELLAKVFLLLVI